MFYFYLICKYLKVKVRQLNKKVKQLKRWNNIRRHMKNILRSYDALFREITQYNITYWSKFLIVFWIGFGTFSVIFLIIFLNQNSNIAIKLICLYSGIANRGWGGGGTTPPTPPPRNGPKNQLTFLFKAFFSFFFANRILHAVKCIKMNFFST